VLFEGGTINVTCYSTSPPTWSFNGQLLNIQADIITIMNATVNDGGTYECHGLDDLQKEFTAHALVLVGGTQYSIT